MSVKFIVDIDGTVCDSNGRIEEVCKSLGVRREDGLDKVWSEETMHDFLLEENLMRDGVIPGAENIFNIAEKLNASVVFLTGRNDYGREATIKWLIEKLNAPEDVPLFMRPPHRRKDYVADCKEDIFLNEIYDHDETYIFFEDHLSTCRRYAKYGLVLKSPECWKAIVA